MTAELRVLGRDPCPGRCRSSCRTKDASAREVLNIHPSMATLSRLRACIAQRDALGAKTLEAFGSLSLSESQERGLFRELLPLPRTVGRLENSNVTTSKTRQQTVETLVEVYALASLEMIAKSRVIAGDGLVSLGLWTSGCGMPSRPDAPYFSAHCWAGNCCATVCRASRLPSQPLGSFYPVKVRCRLSRAMSVLWFGSNVLGEETVTGGFGLI